MRRHARWDVSNPENISNCFVSRLSISDHFPICFSRKVNHKLAKNKHTINSYRSYKHFDETKFLADLSLDLDNFEISYSNLSGFESYPVPNQVVVSSRTTQQLFN